MKLPSPLITSTFVRRSNRFAVEVCVDGRIEQVHLPNSGRLRELLDPANVLYVRPVDSSTRKTKYDLVLVRIGYTLVSADSRLPPKVLAEAIENDTLDKFRGYNEVRPEVTVGKSRLDLLLTGDAPQCYVETKSITLVEDSVALFPDAPTSRGTKHVLELKEIATEGHRAAVVFIVQRDDARMMRPYEEADPEFTQALRDAAGAGVNVLAYRCNVTKSQITISDEIPVEL